MNRVRMTVPESARLFVAAGFASAALRRIIDEACEVERLDVQIRALCRPDQIEVALAEVERREAKLTQRCPPANPALMARRSVRDDLAKGALPPSSVGADHQEGNPRT